MTGDSIPVVKVTVRRAGLTDVPFILATERLPGYGELLATWTAEEHAAALARTDVAYLVLECPAGSAAGFAILEALDDRHQGPKLKRIAVNAPATGLGQPFMRSVLDWVFGQTEAPRLWLDVFVANARARHVYAKAGLSEDGLLRQAYLMPDGRRVDRVLMSILRSEWLARRR